jgi:hypothetical protein
MPAGTPELHPMGEIKEKDPNWLNKSGSNCPIQTLNET